MDKKDILWMTEYFPKPKSFRERVKINLDLSNYAAKVNLKMQQLFIYQNLIKWLI